MLPSDQARFAGRPVSRGKGVYRSAMSGGLVGRGDHLIPGRYRRFLPRPTVFEKACLLVGYI